MSVRCKQREEPEDCAVLKFVSAASGYTHPVPGEWLAQRQEAQGNRKAPSTIIRGLVFNNFGMTWNHLTLEGSVSALVDWGHKPLTLLTFKCCI